MADVIQLRPAATEGSFLCMVEIWRRPDGSIQSVLNSMEGELIDSTGHDVPSRVEIVSGWLLEGAKDMAEQSRHWLLGLEPPQ